MRKRDEVHELRVPPSAEDHVRGPADAPVTIVEYGDYECKDCRRAHSEVEGLMAADEGNVKLVFRHFPLMSLHPNAMAAALAAEAAGRQDKFWQMHARLFEGGKQLDEQRIQQYATELGLDPEAFDRDVNSKEVEAHIRQQRLQGARTGVNGTPTFFINGLRYAGDFTTRALSAAVQAAMGNG